MVLTWCMCVATQAHVGRDDATIMYVSAEEMATSAKVDGAALSGMAGKYKSAVYLATVRARRRSGARARARSCIQLKWQCVCHCHDRDVMASRPQQGCVSR